MNEHIEGIPDGMPCEDFAEDIIWRLEQLHDSDSSMPEAINAAIFNAMEALKALQADLFKRAEAAMVHLRVVEDELQAWVQS